MEALVSLALHRDDADREVSFILEDSAFERLAQLRHRSIEDRQMFDKLDRERYLPLVLGLLQRSTNREDLILLYNLRSGAETHAIVQAYLWGSVPDFYENDFANALAAMPVVLRHWSDVSGMLKLRSPRGRNLASKVADLVLKALMIPELESSLKTQPLSLRREILRGIVASGNEFNDRLETYCVVATPEEADELLADPGGHLAAIYAPLRKRFQKMSSQSQGVAEDFAIAKTSTVGLLKRLVQDSCARVLHPFRKS